MSNSKSRDKYLIDPVYSAKMEAYISVLDKIKNFRLKPGIFPSEYTKQVNREIGELRKRLMASARRVNHTENLRNMCEKDPQFAARWKRIKLESAYINSIKRRRKLDDQITKLYSSLSAEENENEHPSDPHD